jgi:serine/threonine protein kinase/tetratricopeptide (TPR) repeat protein
VSNAPAGPPGRNRLRALYNWIAGTTPPPEVRSPPVDGHTAERPIPARLGHYVIAKRLGEGGMGVVYEARDERLQRAVALKTMSSLSHDEGARRRFWREARAAASVNHPNVCQIYEIGEDQGELFIAMELLEGESLSHMIRRGPFSVPETVPVGLGILNALAALHARGIVHRDLKPSNVFLTPHGVKLLDFGLARPPVDRGMDPTIELTRAGAVMGTPRYMAPEQVMGDTIEPRTDLFAAGAILFEMLAGRPAFVGRTVVEILHATVYEQPPALAGSHAVAALDRVIRRALAKKPGERPASADAMAAELRTLSVAATADDTAELARPLTRLVVLPFRVLRADPETDFLAFSLPDAITSSLSGIASLAVRSSATAAKFAGDTPDLKTLAAEADVDRVVTGTLLRSGDQLRAVAQLIEAPNGTLIASHTVQAPLGDLFRLQDDITREVVKAMSLPLSGAGTPSPQPDAPQSARAYELYLRANEVGRTYDGARRARELYERSLELDPSFAPAWARLGRCHRVIGKYIASEPGSDERAEGAYRRALELNPRLSIAHKFLANLEADTGKSAGAIARLLGEAERHGNDPELFAGLVHACRYCGLYDESIAAHAEARRLDPNVPTSVEQTLLLAGEFERLLQMDQTVTIAGADDVIRVVALGLMDRRDDALVLIESISDKHRIPAFHVWIRHLRSWLARRGPEMFADVADLKSLTILDDPEAIFQEGWMLCDVGDYARGLGELRRAVDLSYFAAPALERARQFDALRSDPAFQRVLEDARAGRDRARDVFRAAGGARLLHR